jgi:hypothetical protein
LRRFGRQQRVRTSADVAWALHGEPADGAQVAVTYRRDGDLRDARLELADGWKECAPTEYAWRPYKWNLSPAPGFGGPVLGQKALAELGLPAGTFAFRVQYLVTWGPRAHRGRAAAAAGIRKGDVVLSFAGRRDFRSLDHFHAWVRLCLRTGQTVDIELLRSGERRTLHYTLPE